jgi:hypothetical protein
MAEKGNRPDRPSGVVGMKERGFSSYFFPERVNR